MDRCSREHLALGLCEYHWQRQNKGLPLVPPPRRYKNKGNLCSYDPCDNPASSLGLCVAHKAQQDRGIELKPIRDRRPELVPRGEHGKRDNQGRKMCTWCGEWKPEGEFGGRATNPDGLERQCKVCLRNRTRRARMRRRLKQYNLTAERWAQMVEDCHGQCPACHRPMAEKDMAIDHDHSCCPGRNISCGKCVRGIICHRCNLGIGYFLDDPEMMREVANYLDRAKH